MSDKTLIIETGIQIQKPVQEIFDAIVDPAKMANYFISESTGKMEEGKKLVWKFPEFTVEIPIRVGKIEHNKYISYYWPGDNGQELLVEITLTAQPDHSTVVSVTEKSRELNEAGLNWLKGNTQGWANFLACLKAYLEYSINLRKGAFLYRGNK